VVQNGAEWCIIVFVRHTEQKPVRQSVSLPAKTAKRVRALARSRRSSANRVLVELIETGLESAENERLRFFELADQLTKSTEPAARQRLKDELARMTFGG
jgi:hypothetical protein